jgi:AmmeMemoRadiSam system protein B
MTWILLSLACTGPAEDSGLPFDQPGWDDPDARRWNRAGSWYPLDPDELDAEIQGLLDVTGASREPARAILSPHARLLSSGAIEAEAYARVEIPELCILVVPNHSSGERVAIWPGGPWLTPGHALETHDEATARLKELIPDLVEDREAFDNHPAEMQLPFMQLHNPETQVVVVSLRDTPDEHFEGFDVERLEAFGEGLATLLGEYPEALLILSTDLTHYESVETSAAQDAELMTHIGNNDVQSLYDYVVTEEVSIGGEIATAIGMAALGDLGHESWDYATRGDSFHVNEDPEAVVGYPAAVMRRLDR